MKKICFIIPFFTICTLISCKRDKLDEKGFQVTTVAENDSSFETNDINRDSLTVETRPGNVLLTGNKNVRLTPLFRVNVNKKDKTKFIGSIDYYWDYNYRLENGKINNWNYHLIPGFEAAFGYNLVNVSHYDIQQNIEKKFFKKPTLIHTLYYPTYKNDTLNNQLVSRDYFMVSAFTEDTNKDGFINFKDLRRFYLFSIDGELQKSLIPNNFSVYKSKYDPENDFLFVYAQEDLNKNGRRDEDEPIHIFWIDLKDPNKTGQLYK